MDRLGNVGIGTTSPDYKLEVSGKIATSTGAIVIEGQEIYANSEYSGNDGSVRINRLGYLGGQTKFRDTVIYNGKGSQIMTIDGSTSSVGIGTTSPTSKLQVAGGIQMADDTATAAAAKVGTMRYRTGTEYVEVDGVE